MSCPPTVGTALAMAWAALALPGFGSDSTAIFWWPWSTRYFMPTLLWYAIQLPIGEKNVCLSGP